MKSPWSQMVLSTSSKDKIREMEIDLRIILLHYFYMKARQIKMVLMDGVAVYKVDSAIWVGGRMGNNEAIAEFTDGTCLIRKVGFKMTSMKAH